MEGKRWEQSVDLASGRNDRPQVRIDRVGLKLSAFRDVLLAKPFLTMRFFSKFLLLLLVPLSGAASQSVTVSASSAIRVAWVERGARSDGPTTLQRTFAPVFELALAGIYGSSTEVVFVPLSASKAAEKLASGEVDAVLQFAPRLSRQIRDEGAHVLKAASAKDPGRFVAFLILAENQSTLEDLLANAFSASINDLSVRESLNDALPGIELASY